MAIARFGTLSVVVFTAKTWVNRPAINHAAQCLALKRFEPGASEVDASATPTLPSRPSST